MVNKGYVMATAILQYQPASSFSSLAPNATSHPLGPMVRPHLSPPLSLPLDYHPLGTRLKPIPPLDRVEAED